MTEQQSNRENSVSSLPSSPTMVSTNSIPEAGEPTITESGENRIAVDKHTLIYSKREANIIKEIFRFLVLTNPSVIKELYQRISPTLHDDLCACFVNLSFAKETIFPLLQYIIQDEFETNSKSQILRENCIASRIVKMYLEKAGHDYLIEVLHKPISNLISSEKRISLEIDIDKVDQEEVERNRAQLEEKVDEILNNLNKRVNQMPIGIRYIAKIVREQTLKCLGPEQENIMIGSFLFLRYINPSIFSPEKVEGLIPKGKLPSDISRRNLILITKVLQNLSNEKNMQSSRKERFMSCLEGFFHKKKPLLVEYYKKVINFQFNPSLVHDAPIYNATDADFQIFHALLDEPDIPSLIKDKAHLEEYNFLVDKLGPYSHKRLITELEENDQKMVREYLEHCIDSEIVLASTVELSSARSGGRRKGVLVIGRNKVYLFKSKDKIIKEFHLLDLVRIESEKPQELGLYYSTNNTDEENIICFSSVDKIDYIITALRRTYAFTFHSNNFAIKVKPEIGRLENINLQLDDSPCSGLVQTYKSLCDYYEGTPVNPIVCYALENFYSRNKTLDIDRFLNNPEQSFSDKDALPLFHALGFNSHFSTLIVKNMKFDKTTLDGLAKMLLINTSISSLTLSSVSLKERHNSNVGFFTLFDAMLKNEKIALTSLDVSNTPLENKRDRDSLAEFIKKLGNNFVKLDLSVGKEDSGEGISSILNAMVLSKAFGNSFTELKLCGIKLEDLQTHQTPLCNFIRKANNLEILNLSGTKINLNFLIAKGLMNSMCCSSLTRLDLSNQKIIKNEDWESLYKWLESPGVCSLQFLDISNTTITTENFKLLLKFQNDNRKDGENLLALRATKNSFNKDTAFAISKIGSRIVSIYSLDLADNGLGDDGIQCLAQSLFHNTVIRKLNLNRNFRFINPQQRTKMIQHLSEMIGSNSLKLESLSIAGLNKGNNKDSRLKESLATLLPCLAKNKYLMELDISGHSSGNPGAFALAQVLEINNTLTKLNWDDNSSSIIGLQTITKSLKLNHSIIQMPVPISDIYKLITGTDKELRREITLIVESLQKIIKRNQKY